MCLSNFPATSGCLQVEPTQLSAVYSRLLEALYITATSEAQAAAPGADGWPCTTNLDPCTRAVDAWQRQAGAQSAKAVPHTAQAYEALAVVRLLGQQDYSGKGQEACCAWLPHSIANAGIMQRAVHQASRTFLPFLCPFFGSLEDAAEPVQP